MMTNSKKILLLIASTTLLFISCKKNTDEQEHSEQYYKSQLEKLIHLKVIPSSSNTKSTQGFKTYKEAYEAFAFVRTGEVFSVKAVVTEVKEPKDKNAHQARSFEDGQPKKYSVSPNLQVNLGNTTTLGCTFTVDFNCQWTAGSSIDEWIPSVVVTKRSDPVYSYSGLGNITGYSSTWTNLSFNGQIQGITPIAGSTTSWFITTKGGVNIVASPQPGGLPEVNATFEATAH
ncbi:hypothetical protein SAMN04488128_10766 [Chitinophaga eiseniae]|uniref:Lipoprotein n=1 Tax=Chitinophaga eiseniae TaxID=634771 RepID=A0A1T4TZD2_9BACT|nr:hypothetical protein [Chitinophaga eiseniae]SKA45661.1 hypothetical protein SAMN04488128_10766 [Chitinophaga eiseniae]